MCLQGQHYWWASSLCENISRMGHSVELFTQQPPNPDIVCSICTDVVKDARTACEEGHVFCEPCITHPRWPAQRLADHQQRQSIQDPAAVAALQQ